MTSTKRDPDLALIETYENSNATFSGKEVSEILRDVLGVKKYYGDGSKDESDATVSDPQEQALEDSYY
jgi:hypothetical protein